MIIEAFETQIEGVKIVKSEVHQDHRGAFYEAFNAEQFKTLGLPSMYAQQNVSYSLQGVLRGIHMQKNNPQGKLIRCIGGVIWDVWVDLRKDSKTFGKWGSLSLGGKDVEAVYIPPGLAHGFFVVSSFAIVHYSCTTLYDKESDGGIRWDDDKVSIEWPFPSDVEPLVSPKDMNLPPFDEYIESLR